MDNTWNGWPLSRIGRAALRYSELGYNIFPCLPKSKRPATQNGFKDATRDSEQISSWWRHNPRYNLGLPTGSINRVLVVDFDFKDGIRADDAMFEFEREFGKLPETPYQMTGNYGLQFFFEEREPIATAIRVRTNTDIKGEGGYVIVPPSTHPNGTLYAWDEMHKLGDIELASLPKSLKDILATHRSSPTSKSAGHWGDLISHPVCEGSRHSTLLRILGHLLGKRVDSRIAEIAIHAINRSVCHPPLPDGEVNNIFRNLGLREANKRDRSGL